MFIDYAIYRNADHVHIDVDESPMSTSHDIANEIGPALVEDGYLPEPGAMQKFVYTEDIREDGGYFETRSTATVVNVKGNLCIAVEPGGITEFLTGKTVDNARDLVQTLAEEAGL